MSAKTINTKTKKHYESKGYLVESVEKYNAFTRRKSDLLGFLDYLAIGNGEIVGVQTTSIGNTAARKKKILGSDKLQAWLSAGGQVEVIGIGKGRDKRVWRLSQGEWVLVERIHKGEPWNIDIH